MPRNISVTAMRAIFDQETEQAFVILMTITHPMLDDPIRVTNNAVDLISGGNTYIAYPFMVSLPNEQEDQIPSVRLTIDNVSRNLTEAVESISSAATVAFSVVRAAEADVIEAGPWTFKLRNVTYDAFSLEGTIDSEDILNEPFPAPIYNPETTPGLFSSVAESGS